METVFRVIRYCIMHPIVMFIKWILIIFICTIFGPFIYLIRNLCTHDYKTFSYICEWIIKDFIDDLAWDVFKL